MYTFSSSLNYILHILLDTFSVTFYYMDWPMKLLFTVLLLIVIATNGANGDALVTGTVFCDQCKDGHVTLFDYPLNGIKVAITCVDSNGQVSLQREDTTNWVGSYNMRFDGTPNLNACQAKVLGPTQGPISCGAASGPPQNPRLLFSMFGMEMYSVDPLLSQPSQPMSSCSTSATPVHLPPPPVVVRPPPHVGLTPVPRPPQLPPVAPLPPMPFLEASACPYWEWTMPEHKCYWKIINPSTKVGVAFGLIAARRYGTNMTLNKAMQGKGDPYRTLLREATTALLNSYNTLQFQYHPLLVIQDFNLALLGSNRQVLYTALRFKRANSGNGHIGCKFTTCK